MLFYVNLVKFEIYLTHRKAREALTATSLLQNKPNPVGASQGSVHVWDQRGNLRDR